MMNKKLNQPFYGLVLAGGKSGRMGIDKAFLEYRGMPQYKWIYQLISPYCKKTFISGQQEKHYDYDTITDDLLYEEVGPLAGLMTAFDLYPAPWLVVAIDYPYLESSDIEHLIHQRDVSYDATVYYNYESQYFEPFIGIYEVNMLRFIKTNGSMNGYSAQKILLNQMVKKVSPLRQEILQSVDTREAREQVKGRLK